MCSLLPRTLCETLCWGKYPWDILRSGGQCRGSSWAWWIHSQRHKKRVPCRSLTCQHHQMGIRLTRTNAPASKKRSSVAPCMARGRIQSARLFLRIFIFTAPVVSAVPRALIVLLAFFFTHYFTTLFWVVFWVGNIFFNGGGNVGCGACGACGASSENNGGECHVRS